MTARQFLSRLERVHPIRGGWQARCPAHDDKNPSLSVSERERKILLRCHAGCEASAIVGALGLSMADLFSDSAPSGKGAGGHRKALTTAELAAAKKLPVEFLKEFGLQDSADGVLIPYRLVLLR